MNNNTVMRVLTFRNQLNEGVFGDSESNKKEIIEFLSSVPDFGDFIEKEKTVTCVKVNGCDFGILYAIMGIVIDVARRHKISPLALCIGLMSILLNNEKKIKDLKDNKEDSLVEILKKMNKESMN